MSIFSFFKRGLQKSATKISRVVSSVFTGIKAHDSNSFDDLEALLISADFGVPAALQITGRVRERYECGEIATDADLVKVTRDEVARILSSSLRPVNSAEPGKPVVILMVGVNGSGKTTSIGKLAAKWKNEGKKVVLGACDTFRAAAIDQLKVWADRSDCEIIAREEGSDPSSVVFDALLFAAASASCFCFSNFSFSAFNSA